MDSIEYLKEQLKIFVSTGSEIKFNGTHFKNSILKTLDDYINKRGITADETINSIKILISESKMDDYNAVISMGKEGIETHISKVYSIEKLIGKRTGPNIDNISQIRDATTKMEILTKISSFISTLENDAIIMRKNLVDILFDDITSEVKIDRMLKILLKD